MSINIIEKTKEVAGAETNVVFKGIPPFVGGPDFVCIIESKGKGPLGADSVLITLKLIKEIFYLPSGPRNIGERIIWTLKQINNHLFNFYETSQIPIEQRGVSLSFIALYPDKIFCAQAGDLFIGLLKTKDGKPDRIIPLGVLWEPMKSITIKPPKFLGIYPDTEFHFLTQEISYNDIVLSGSSSIIENLSQDIIESFLGVFPQSSVDELIEKTAKKVKNKSLVFTLINPPIKEEKISVPSIWNFFRTYKNLSIATVTIVLIVSGIIFILSKPYKKEINEKKEPEYIAKKIIEELPAFKKIKFEKSWKLFFNDALSATPLLVNEKIVSACRDNKVRLINPADGKIEWVFNTNYGIGSSPATDGENIFVANYNGDVFSLKPEQDSIKSLNWKVELGNKIVAPLSYYDRNLIVADMKGNLYNLNSKNGDIKWKVLVNEKDSIWAQPAVTSDYVVVGTLNNLISVYSLDKGQLKWSLKTFGGVYGITCDDNLIYVTDKEGVVSAIRIEDGFIFWDFNAESHIPHSPAIVGNKLIFGCNNGMLYALNISTGKPVWKVKLKGDIKARPVIYQGIVFVSSYDENVYALSSSKGDIIGKVFVSNLIYASPLVWDRSMVVSTLGGNLWLYKLTQ